MILRVEDGRSLSTDISPMLTSRLVHSLAIRCEIVICNTILMRDGAAYLDLIISFGGGFGGWFFLLFSFMSSRPKAYYAAVDSDGIQPRVSSKHFYDYFERFVVLPCQVVQVSRWARFAVVLGTFLLPRFLELRTL